MNVLLVTVRLDDVVITHNTNAAGTEVVFNCNPLLSNVVDVGTVEIEVEWFVNDRVVEEDTFRLQDKTVGTLGQTMWSVGQTVRGKKESQFSRLFAIDQPQSERHRHISHAAPPFQCWRISWVLRLQLKSLQDAY